jgi:NAD(P)-dependent dehydrogenase (short-subunit alcohol dehydrogenase family)
MADDGLDGGDEPKHCAAEDTFDRILAVNLKGIWLRTKAALGFIRDQECGAAIVNISALVAVERSHLNPLRAFQGRRKSANLRGGISSHGGRPLQRYHARPYGCAGGAALLPGPTLALKLRLTSYTRRPR